MSPTTRRFRALILTVGIIIATNVAISKVATIRPSAPRPKASIAMVQEVSTSTKVATIRPSAPRP